MADAKGWTVGVSWKVLVGGRRTNAEKLGVESQQRFLLQDLQFADDSVPVAA